jgi:hypothetical protein
MSVMRNQTVVSLEDFRYVSILCRHCKSKTVLDMLAPVTLSASTGRSKWTPSQCPICFEAFDSALEQFDGFQRAYAAICAARLAGQLRFFSGSEFDSSAHPVIGVASGHGEA